MKIKIKIGTLVAVSDFIVSLSQAANKHLAKVQNVSRPFATVAELKTLATFPLFGIQKRRVFS